MSQPTCQDASPDVYNVNGTQTIFLATRQELLKRIQGLSPGSEEDTCQHQGFSGQQRPTWRTSS